MREHAPPLLVAAFLLGTAALLAAAEHLRGCACSAGPGWMFVGLVGGLLLAATCRR